MHGVARSLWIRNVSIALGVASFVGCSDAPTGLSQREADRGGSSSSPSTADSASADAAADPAPPTAATWTTVYAAYFGPGSLGHCSDTGCHATALSGFTCGTSQASCYQGLVTGSFINPANPSASNLVGANSPLKWFGQGRMPTGGSANPAAKAAIAAWVSAGAKNN